MSDETRTKYASIYWQALIDTRDHLVRDYDSVDYDRVWQILTVNVPELLAGLQETLNHE